MKHSDKFTSITNTHVNYDIYTPNVMIRYKAIVMIYHAMAEYSGRYERFGQYLANDGFVVVVSDFPGHGTSLYNNEQGYFGLGDATHTLVEDMHRLRSIMATRYPDLPIMIIGNQLGSLILRQYMAKYGDFIQGAILMGTCGKANRSLLRKLVIKGDSLIKGKMNRSKTIHKNIINRLIFQNKNGSYISDDERELQQYKLDPFTDFIYTNEAYDEVLALIKEVSSMQSIKKIPEYLSVYIVSGLKDAFGKFGNGPKWLYETLKNNGVKDISLSLYENSHHDILHDVERLVVYQDILDWLNARTYI